MWSSGSGGRRGRLGLAVTGLVVLVKGSIRPLHMATVALTQPAGNALQGGHEAENICLLLQQ